MENYWWRQSIVGKQDIRLNSMNVLLDNKHLMSIMLLLLKIRTSLNGFLPKLRKPLIDIWLSTRIDALLIETISKDFQMTKSLWNWLISWELLFIITIKDLLFKEDKPWKISSNWLDSIRTTISNNFSKCIHNLNNTLMKVMMLPLITQLLKEQVMKSELDILINKEMILNWKDSKVVREKISVLDWIRCWNFWIP